MTSALKCFLLPEGQFRGGMEPQPDSGRLRNKVGVKEEGVRNPQEPGKEGRARCRQS